PEVAITVSAAAKGNLGLAAGNLIGGVAVQTLVLVICDAVASRDQALTYLVGKLVPVLEGLLVIFVVCGVLMGSLLPESTSIGPVSPASLGIVLAWFSGIYAINAARKAPRWKIDMPGSRPGDNELAVADIFGGNAFQVCLFLVADVIAGKPVLPTAGHQNSWL